VHARSTLRAAGLIASLVCVSCGGNSNSTPGAPTPNPNPTPVPTPTPTPTPGPSLPQVFVGAGDIAQCGALDPAYATARLVQFVGGTVFTLGDNAYFEGSADQFKNCYDPTWGPFKSFTRPVPGNHEYETSGAAPYYDYFGPNAGMPGLGYYSFELGDWHAVALNSLIDVGANSAQAAWLKADLASSTKKCTIAYWHYPLFTSGQNLPNPQMRDFWRILYNAGVEIVLNGHDHLYERFAPQTPDGIRDDAKGIRQFTAGSGGAALYNFVTNAPNSEKQIRNWGVLKLTLSSDHYDWQFIAVSGAGDSGGPVACH
jgi:calcineurin-like phosphoesterase family protein